MVRNFLFHILLKWLTITTLCLFFVPICSEKIRAQVVINEVHPAPSAGNDWIELYNLGSTSVNLTGWTLEDSSSVMTTSPTLTNQSISMGGFFAVEVGNRLNSTGDKVTLKTAAGTESDSFTYSRSIIDQSWSRNTDGTGGFELMTASRGMTNRLGSSPVPTPTPSSTPSPTPSPSPSPEASPSPSVSPTPTPSPPPILSPTPAPIQTPMPTPTPSPPPVINESLPAHIVLSEIMACPNTGDPEWVEIQNLDSSPYILNNWQLKDSQNNSRYFSNSIPAQGFLVVAVTPAMLNNTGGDQVSIVRPDGVTTSWASYLSCEKGKSLIFSGQSWEIADPTPGLANPEQQVVTSTSAQTSEEESQTTQASSPTPSPKTIPAFTPSSIEPQETRSQVLGSTFTLDTEETPKSTSSSQTANNSEAQIAMRVDTQQNTSSNKKNIETASYVLLFSSSFFALGITIVLGLSWYTELREKDVFNFS